MSEWERASGTALADVVKHTVMMNMAPIFLRNSLQLGTHANSAALRAALLQWCYSSRNFGANPTASSGNGTGADDDKMQVPRPTRALQTSTRARTVAELDIGRRTVGDVEERTTNPPVTTATRRKARVTRKTKRKANTRIRGRKGGKTRFVVLVGEAGNLVTLSFTPSCKDPHGFCCLELAGYPRVSFCFLFLRQDTTNVYKPHLSHSTASCESSSRPFDRHIPERLSSRHSTKTCNCDSPLLTAIVDWFITLVLNARLYRNGCCSSGAAARQTATCVVSVPVRAPCRTLLAW